MMIRAGDFEKKDDNKNRYSKMGNNFGSHQLLKIKSTLILSKKIRGYHYVSTPIWDNIFKPSKVRRNYNAKKTNSSFKLDRV